MLDIRSLPPKLRRESLECPRCFHVIGEHYLCLEHGGESAWSLTATRYKPNQVDYPPPEASENFQHPWWRFLDVQVPEMRLPEAIP